MVEPESLEHERLRLERDKLRFERQKFAAELRLKRSQLAPPKSTLLKEVFANPLALAIVGGFLTLMTGIATTTFTARETREAEALRASYTRENARDTLQADLIKKFVEGPSPDAVRNNLHFLVDAGLLPSYADDIRKYLKDNPGAAPQVSTSSTSISSGAISKSGLQQILDDGHLLGLDMSAHSPDADFPALKERGVTFAYHKATEGAAFIDTKAAERAMRARQTGLKVGLYHFFSSGSDAAAQFANFSARLTAIPWDLPPVIDCENAYGSNHHHHKFRPAHRERSSRSRTRADCDRERGCAGGRDSTRTFPVYGDQTPR
jgi:hypothetical protein